MDQKKTCELSISMKELPSSEQPYERCLLSGAQSLTDAQLLAVILKTGSRKESALQLAQRLLMEQEQHPGLDGLLYMKLPDYLKIHGIGQIKAVTLLCVVELAKRLSLCRHRASMVLNDSESVAHYYMELMNSYQKEHFYCLLLDGKNALIKELEISIGTVNASLASPREVMIEILRYEAVRFIVLHNHPSGDPTPSTADILLTGRLKKAGELLDVELLDHIVIGAESYVSMKASQLI